MTKYLCGASLLWLIFHLNPKPCIQSCVHQHFRRHVCPRRQRKRQNSFLMVFEPLNQFIYRAQMLNFQVCNLHKLGVKYLFDNTNYNNKIVASFFLCSLCIGTANVHVFIFTTQNERNVISDVRNFAVAARKQNTSKFTNIRCTNI